MRHLEAGLSCSSISNLIEDIKSYQRELNEKCSRYAEALSTLGVEIAQQTVGNFGKYIIFDFKIEDAAECRCTSIFYATNSSTITSQWKLSTGEIRSVDISPLLMAEFGSGFKAENPLGVPGVGQGSLNTYGHAFDPNGWYWTDLSGNRHHSTGASPTMPMYNACLELMDRALEIANEIFN